MCVCVFVIAVIKREYTLDAHPRPEENCDLVPGLHLAFGLREPDQQYELFYKRNENGKAVEKVHTALDKGRTLYVCGVPGTGKSTAVWNGSIQWLSKQESRCKILWIHFFKRARCVCASIENDTARGIVIHSRIGVNANDSLERFLDDNHGEYSALILDSINEDPQDKFETCLNGNYRQDRRPHIFVASGKKSAPKPHEWDDGDLDTFEMPSWTYEDYCSACMRTDHTGTLLFEKQKSFICGDAEMRSEAVGLDTLVGEKYYYAGGSARWFFKTAPHDIIATIDHYLLECDKTKLAEVDVSLRAAQTVLALYRADRQTNEFNMPRFQYSIVSKLAMHQLVGQLDEKIMLQLVGTLGRLRNPSLDGWIFEAEFIWAIERGKDFCVKGLSYDAQQTVEATAKIEASEAERFKCRLEDVPRLKEVNGKFDLKDALEKTNNAFWITSKWNQETFDLVEFRRTGIIKDDGSIDVRLIFYQLTAALDKHEIKTKYLLEAINLFQKMKGIHVSNVQFIGLYPEGNPEPCFFYDCRNSAFAGADNAYGITVVAVYSVYMNYLQQERNPTSSSTKK